MAGLVNNTNLNDVAFSLLVLDGYTDKQIAAIAYLMKCAEGSCAHESVNSFAGIPFPSGGMIICRPTAMKFENTPFSDMRSFSGVMSGIRKKAENDKCPYMMYRLSEPFEYYDSRKGRYVKDTTHNRHTWYFDRDLFNDGTW